MTFLNFSNIDMENNKVKILHAITRLDRGGSSDNTLLSAIGLVERGYEVDLLFGSTEDANLELLEKARKAGVEFIEEEDLARNIRPGKDITALLDIIRFLRDNKYDIVHAHTSKAGLLCRIAAKIAGVKIIVFTPHGHVFYGYLGKVLTRLIIFIESLVAHITDKIIGLTQAECDEWLSFGVGRKEQYTVVHSGVNFDLLGKEDEKEDLRSVLSIPDNRVLVGSIGRFVDIKGYEYFIEAASIISKKRDDVNFILAGDGPLLGKYRKMIEEKGIKGRFNILGWQDNAAAFINGLDVFVLPSVNEGMGRVVVQAMFFEKPVVGTRVGGVPSVLEGGAGIVVETRSSEAIAKAVLDILDDPGRMSEMAKRGKEKVISGYSVDEMIDKLDELYKELLNSKSTEYRVPSIGEV